MWHIQTTEGVHTAFRWGDLNKKKTLERPRHRWEDNIKVDLKEVGWGGMNWNDLAQDRYGWWVPVNAVMNFGVPQMG
jgi:hypothetical protein